MSKFLTLSNVCLYLLCSFCLILTSCANYKNPVANKVRQIAPEHSLTVAPIYQPKNTAEMLIKHKNLDLTLRADPNELLALDDQLRYALQTDIKRYVKYLKAGDAILPEFEQSKANNQGDYHSSHQPQALPLWEKTAQNCQSDYLLVPYVLSWRERVGTNLSIAKPAYLYMEFYLFNNAGILIQRSIFEEEQQSLSENLLNMPDFVKRKGQWITVNDLAKEAILKALEEFGLISTKAKAKDNSQK